MGIINRIWRRPFRRDDDRYFRTPNLHLAVILFAKEHSLVNIDQDDPAHCEFVFPNSYELQEIVERFKKRKPIYVDARKLIHSWKLLRGKMNGERF